MKGRKKPRRTMPWGEEAQCSRCKGWWPADAEFFTMLHGKIAPWCRACKAEQKIEAKNMRKAA